MCNDFSPAKTRQQTAKPQKKKKKNVSIPRMDEKKLLTR